MDLERHPGAVSRRHGQPDLFGCLSVAASGRTPELCASATRAHRSRGRAPLSPERSALRFVAGTARNRHRAGPAAAGASCRSLDGRYAALRHLAATGAGKWSRPMTPGMIADSIVNLCGAIGVGVAMITLYRRDPRSPLTRRLLVALGLIALLFLVRGVAWRSGSGVLDDLSTIPSALIP